MTATRLLKHFDRVADAPGAVARLRHFILDLAVRGWLAEHHSDDESASRLTTTVPKTFPESVREGNGALSSERLEIPQTWSWISIGEAAHVEMGQSPPSEHYNKSKLGMPFYQGKTDFGPRYPTPRWWCTSPSKIARAGDILISVRAPVGPTNIANEECCIGRGLAALRPRKGIDVDFLLLSLEAFRPALEALGFGTTFVAINKKQLMTFAIPVPPEIEQKRTVAKVTELMAVCDRLEAAQADRETRRDRVVAAALQRLDEAPAGRKRCDVHLNLLPRLTSRPQHVRQLRETVSNLAFRGRLVPQDSRNEPASKLLERIEADRGRLMRQRSVGQVAGGPPPEIVTALPDIPDSWRWVSLSQVSLGFRYGTSIKCEYQAEGEPVLRIPNVANGRIEIDDLKFGRLSAREAADLRLQLGDILVVRSNGSLDLVGRPAQVEASAVGFCYAGYLVRVRTNPQLVDTRYLTLALSSRHVRDQIEIPIRSTVGLKNVNTTEFGQLTFPLAPLAEQHRIVAKVDELIALFDRIETQSAAAETVSSRLLEVLLQQALTAPKSQ